MKNLLLVVVAAVISLSVKSQNFNYGGIGYNAAFLNSEGLNFVIDRYNETRPYLTEAMPYNNYYDGLTLHAGGASNSFVYDFGITTRSSKVHASGVDATGQEIQRDLKNKWNTFDIGLGISLGNSETKALMFGINTAINSEKSLTRSATPDEIGAANFEKVNSQFKVGFEPFIQLILANYDGLGILFKPYYSWTPIQTDYAELNRYINPYTYVSDPVSIKGKLSGFGMSIMVVGFGVD